MPRITGVYEAFGSLNHFIPNPLPPHHPPLEISPEMLQVHGQAMHNLGQLKAMTARVPDKDRFVKAYILKEALLSSDIEGIHTTLLDAFTQPIDAKPKKQTQLVLNYTYAANIAVSMITQEDLPLSSRVILAAHKALMEYGEGDKANPGNYRKQSVRVGNLVPAPATKVAELMSQLEHFINDEQSPLPLIKAGLAHVQFETIHPFLDGNGRIGRLLIVLMFIKSGLLSEPILYPSYYFKKNQMEYYQRLDGVRIHGDFEGWITFYLHAINESAINALVRIKNIEVLEHGIIQEIDRTKFSAKNKQQLQACLQILFQFPVISIGTLAEQIKKSYNTATALMKQLIELGIVESSSEQKRGRLYIFKKYLAALE